MDTLTWQSSQAEDLKKTKYSYLEGKPDLVFTPVAVGVLGPLSLIFLKELGHAQLVTQKAMHTCSSTFQWLYKGEMQPPSKEHFLPLLTSIVFKCLITCVSRYAYACCICIYY